MSTTRTIEEIRAELAAAEAIERAEKEKQRRAYEDLKSETVETLCLKAINLNEELAKFKNFSFEAMQTVWEMLKEYSDRASDGKGNFTIESGDFRIIYKRQGKPSFDERAEQAEKHIIDFVNSKFEDEADTRELIMSLLERKKGELDINLIQKLYKMENTFDDANWKKGISLLKESYTYSHSKDYINFKKRGENGEWQNINLAFSNI